VWIEPVDISVDISFPVDKKTPFLRLSTG